MRGTPLQLLRWTNAALLLLDAAGLVFAAVGFVAAALLAASGNWQFGAACGVLSLGFGARALVQGRREWVLRRTMRRGGGRRRLATQ
ncbi:hypothetical protein CELL_01611 [Cellulomonas sp. T2.31MG-18]